MTFNKRSEYVYKTATECFGFSIRKKQWINLLNENPKISDELTEQLRNNYFKHIKNRMQKMYEKEMHHQLNRADYDAMLRVVKHNEIDKSNVEHIQNSRVASVAATSVAASLGNNNAATHQQDGDGHQGMELRDQMEYYSQRCQRYEHQINDLFTYFDSLLEEHFDLREQHDQVLEELEQTNAQLDMYAVERSM